VLVAAGADAHHTLVLLQELAARAVSTGTGLGTAKDATQVMAAYQRELDAFERAKEAHLGKNPQDPLDLSGRLRVMKDKECLQVSCEAQLYDVHAVGSALKVPASRYGYVGHTAVPHRLCMFASCWFKLCKWQT
jgi:hypothetical protein